MLQRHSYHINYTQNIKLSSAEGLVHCVPQYKALGTMESSL